MAFQGNRSRKPTQQQQHTKMQLHQYLEKLEFKTKVVRKYKENKLIMMIKGTSVNQISFKKKKGYCYM